MKVNLHPMHISSTRCCITWQLVPHSLVWSAIVLMSPLACQEPWILLSQGLNDCMLSKTALTRIQESRKIWLKMMNSQWKCLSNTFNYLDILNLLLQGDKTLVNTSKKLNLFQVFFLLSADFNCQNIVVSQSWIVLAHCQLKYPMQCQFFWSSSRIVQLTNVKIFTSFQPTMLLQQNMILHHTKSNCCCLLAAMWL